MDPTTTAPTPTPSSYLHSSTFFSPPLHPQRKRAPLLLPLATKDRKRKHASPPLDPTAKQALSRILTTEAAVLRVGRRAAAAMANAKSKRRLWPRAVLEALDEAIAHGRWEAALQIFSLLRNQVWYKPRSQTYARLIALLGKCGRAKEANEIFHFMRSEGFKPTIDVYTSLAGAYGGAGLLEEAFQIMDEMKTVLQSQPDEYTYTVLINACVRLKQFDHIPRLLDEMTYVGVESNIVTYNSIVDGYGKAGLLEDMECFLHNMLEEAKCIPDLYTMNSVLWSFGNKGKIDEMERWYGEFQLMGIEPDVQTLNILIKSYGNFHAYRKMISVLRYMNKRFFTPTVVTYNSIIECFGRNGQIEKMEYYFRLMKIKGIKPNSRTYCSLVNSYRKDGMLYKISGVIRQTENSDVTLDTPFFNCVINAFGKAGEVGIMEEMFSLMKEKGCKPDMITFETMIQVYDSCGMVEAAYSLRMKTKEMGKKLLE
ncbi:hypothetical protein LUZ63_015723 [Rhynchospora breviuscula]|uniref:Pentatricopeptide repeat-containing protein n=1 Tax=Rhynchospora breviuscula TaxID=2022672 RepID=A0A9Q0CCV3_9POAL|nr:hypothetical protein LUZ63_015723 [Rhynchospora breviuscula]